MSDLVETPEDRFSHDQAHVFSFRCGICGESAAKYKCPGCLVHTCSLPCVKQHKNTSGCSGQRDKTAFVAMKELTDLNMLSGRYMVGDDVTL